MSNAKRRAVSLAEAARLLGKHRNTVSGWLAAGCPAISAARREQGAEWQLDLGAVLDWHVRRAVAAERERHAVAEERLRRALEQGGADGEPIARPEAMRRRAIALARLAELDVAEREGQLIPASDLAEAMGSLSSAVMLRLGAVPVRSAGDHAALGGSAAEHEAISRAFIREATEAIADYLAAADADDPDDDDGESAA